MKLILSRSSSSFQEKNTNFSELILLRRENIDLKREIVILRADTNMWKTQHQKTRKREEEQKKEIQNLKAKIRLREKQLFARKSEKKKFKKNSSQKINKTKRKRGQQRENRGPKRRDFSNLEKKIEIIDLCKSEKYCKNCGAPLSDTNMTSDSKQIEIKVKAHIRFIKRKIYRTTCPCKKRELITAKHIHKIISKSILGNSIWAHLLVEKYGHGIPLNRLMTSLSLSGLNLSQGTIIGGFHKLKPILKPIFDAIKEKGLEESNWNVDETGWPVFEEVKEKSNFCWWLWVFRSPSTVFFLLDPSRSAKVIDKYFDKKISGIINCDRYKAYIKFARLYEGTILLSYCWAHLRRDFLSLANKYPKYEDWGLEWVEKIGAIYYTNSLRISHARWTKKFKKYDLKLKRLVSEFFENFKKQLKDKKLEDPCEKVLKSLNNHWKGLSIFVNNPEISMDNNKAERSLRGPVVGRKNYYGSGSRKMGNFAVIIFSILQTLLLWKINPKKWLIWYFSSCSKFDTTPQSIKKFLPWNMDKEKFKELRLDTS